MLYDYKRAITIENSSETTWQMRYPWPMETTYDQVLGFIFHEFKNILFKINMEFNPRKYHQGIQLSIEYWK